MKAIEDDDICEVKIHYYDIKSQIRSIIQERRQIEWQQTNCWLQRLKPVLLDWKSAYRKIRREEVILARLRTNTPLFKIKHHIDPESPKDFCTNCQVYTNIYHVILTCPQYERFRGAILAYFNQNNLSVSINGLLDDNFPFEVLFEYLKTIQYYNRI